jgi:hypothetical protein
MNYRHPAWVQVTDDKWQHIACKGWVGQVVEEQQHPTLTFVKFPQRDNPMAFSDDEIILFTGSLGEGC